MSWKINLFVSISGLIIGSCNSPAVEEISDTNYVTNHLMEVPELETIINNDTIVVIDFRRPSEYAVGHLPGALNIWRPDIENDSIDYQGVMASKLKIENLFSNLGISTSDFLVIYDNNASCDAARLWWVLDYYGFDRTALLNGGLNAWNDVNEITDKIIVRNETEFVLPDQSNSNHYISFEEMSKTYISSSLKIIDNRSMEEYQGLSMKSGAYDSGRIEGSINIDWTEFVNYENQKFQSEAVLKDIFKSNGIEPLSDIVVYCHTGVRSSHAVFVLTELLGYQNVRNYEGSWVEWSYYKMPATRSSLSIDQKL